MTYLNYCYQERVYILPYLLKSYDHNWKPELCLLCQYKTSIQKLRVINRSISLYACQCDVISPLFYLILNVFEINATNNSCINSSCLCVHSMTQAFASAEPYSEWAWMDRSFLIYDLSLTDIAECDLYFGDCIRPHINVT